MLYPDLHDLITYKKQLKSRSLPSFRSIKSIAPGNRVSALRGQGLEFDAVREYVPGDDIRNIDWRVTARTGAPHLKLFKEERERQLVICVDMNAGMRFGTKNTFKSVQAARIVSFLGWQGIAQQDRVSACLFGDVPHGIQYFAPKRTHSSFYTILKTLTDAPVEEHNIPLEKALEHISQNAQAGSLVYLISDFLEFEETSLKRLNSKCDLLLIAVNDQADKSIYPLGRVGFCANGSEICIDTTVKSGREAYAAQWMVTRKRLQEIAMRFKIPLIELSTESDVRSELSLKLKNASRRKR